MPVESLELTENQTRLFQSSFSEELNNKHKLYKFRSIINWSKLEKEILSILKVNPTGRNRKSMRMMLGLCMLQAMHNSSDRVTSEMLEENVYWQYFCGYEYVEVGIKISESSVRRFRQDLGSEGHEMILQELKETGLRVGAYKKKDLKSVLIDTTVQIKNIRYPHDAHLLGKAREEAVKLSNRVGLKLNETYAKKYKTSLLKLWKYKTASKSKQRKKLMSHMKTLVGRLIRRVEQGILKKKVDLSLEDSLLLDKIKKVHAQSFLSSQEKKLYKAKGNKIIYSFHAEEVECIGKGKLNKPYEFGNKVSVAVTGRNNFIIGIKSFHGNPYDGHTLSQTIDNVEKITNHETDKIFVDLGYRGNNYSKKSKIYTPYTKKHISPSIKKMQKRRSAIEPVIGHLKQYGRMARNFLKGVIGDIINPLISAIGFNLRNIANHIMASP